MTGTAGSDTGRGGCSAKPAQPCGPPRVPISSCTPAICFSEPPALIVLLATGSEFIAEAALEAEDTILGGRIPSCVVRLGYLYGPESRDLRLYRNAFRIGRPYWAGSARVLQRHLQTTDAATALLATARQLPAGKTLCATDDTPASFAAFMDRFARLVGNPLPLHIPRAARPLTRLLIAEEHVQLVDLASGDAPDRPRPRGWVPMFPNYRSGLRDVVDAWNA